jgi:hypothetical protein
MSKESATREGVLEPKAKTDWERVEADYRAGLLSVREIAAAQGISHTAIQKRAKAEGWERDLSAKIQAKADALVAKREVATQVATETAVSERLIVEANAEVIAQVRMAHRSDITRSRKLAMALLAEVEIQTESLELFEELGDFLRADDEKAQDKRNDVYKRVISGAGRVDSMKKLADTLKVLIGLEREAYSIDNAPEAPKEPATADQVTEGFADIRAAFAKRLNNAQSA